jgi:hypothetical protein
MTERINYNLIDGEPVANRDCYYHHTERCTLISKGTYLTSCIPSSHSTCIPGLRLQRDRFKKTLEEFAEGDCSYGDNCPESGTNHGRCTSCIARSALGWRDLEW